jgi:hypothetical protein
LAVGTENPHELCVIMIAVVPVENWTPVLLNTKHNCSSLILRLVRLNNRSKCDKLSHCMPWWHMGGIKVQIHTFLNLTLYECQVSYTHRDKGYWYPRNSSLVAPRTCLEALSVIKKEKAHEIFICTYTKVAQKLTLCNCLP